MKKLSDTTKAAMSEILNFVPVEDKSKPLIRVLTPNGIVCYDSGDLRNFACAFLEMAEWLDFRAGLETKTQENLPNAAGLLLSALRQYRHNDNSGFVAGYEIKETEKIVTSLMVGMQDLMKIAESANQLCSDTLQEFKSK